MPTDMMDLISRLLDMEEAKRGEEATETPLREFEILPGVGTKGEGMISLGGGTGGTGGGGGAAGAPPGPEITGTTDGATTVQAAAPTTWEERFAAEHGRYPNQKDRMDREWSEQHAGLYGRPPTEDEWKWNYFNPNPDLMKKYFPSAGGGGAAAYYGQIAPDAEVPEPLGELAWWGPDAAPPLLRPWATWFQELVEMNRLAPIAFPFDRDEAAEIAADQELIETGEEFAVPGFTSTRGVLDRLQGLLGLEFGEDVKPTEKWQSLITAIPGAGFEAQQLLASLRYSPEQAWYSVDIGQLVRPEYL